MQDSLKIENILNELQKSDQEKFRKGIKMLGMSAEDLMGFYLNRVNSEGDIDLSIANFYISPDRNKILEDFVKDKKINRDVMINFLEVNRKFITIFLFRLKSVDQELYQVLAGIHQPNMFFLDELIGPITVKEIINHYAIQTFDFIGQRDAHIKIFKKLKSKKIFVDDNTEWTDYDKIFTPLTPNSKIKKVNWIGSFLELKEFIKLLASEKLIKKCASYNSIIVDCFMVKNNDISIQQIRNPNSSKRNFNMLKEIFALH